MYNTWKVIAALFFDRYVQKVKEQTRLVPAFAGYRGLDVVTSLKRICYLGTKAAHWPHQEKETVVSRLGPLYLSFLSAHQQLEAYLAGLSSKSMAVWTY